jgi:RHS repeat-associated protein
MIFNLRIRRFDKRAGSDGGNGFAERTGKHVVKTLMALFAATYSLGASSQTVTPPLAAETTAVFYIISDQINTAREIIDSTGAKVWTADSDPFGANPPNDNPSGFGKFTYNPRFPGQYFDRETGLNYNYFRDYDPQTGRYLQSDPIGLAGGINTYGYVHGNPVALIDFYGLQVNMNLHTPGTPAYKAAELIRPPPNTFSIGGHGNEWWPVGPDGEGITAGVLAELISHHKDYSPGKKIIFYVCDLGKGTYPQDVTDLLGNISMAPSEYLYTYSGGKKPLIAAPSAKNPDIPDMSRRGKWVEFRKAKDCECKK